MPPRYALNATWYKIEVIFTYTNIFQKEIKDQPGSFTVDILLDNSASQQDRQSIIAAQGFIIAEALTKLQIPTRVLGFNNFNHISNLLLLCQLLIQIRPDNV